MRKMRGGWTTGVVLFFLLAMGLLFPWAAVAVPSAEQTPPPTVTAKPVDAPPLPSPAASPFPAPTVPPTPISTPEPPLPIPWLPPDLGRLITDYRLEVGLSCLLLFLLLLAVVLILVIWRGGRRHARKPTAPLRPAAPPSAPPAAALPCPYLRSIAAPGNPRFDLRPEGVTVGRGAENDLVITQDMPGWVTVSRQHARIYRWADRWIVEDLQSTNGVYVNGKRTGRNVLRDGWRIGIGGIEFDFHAAAEEAER